MHQWISVKEKLPELDKIVLICCKTIRIAKLCKSLAIFEGERDLSWCDPYSNRGEDWVHTEITHWMELPDAPVD